jgi:hypothetical protein
VCGRQAGLCPLVATNNAPVATLGVDGLQRWSGVADDVGHVLDRAAHVGTAGLVGDGMEVVDIDGAPKEVVVADLGQSAVLGLRRLSEYNVACKFGWVVSYLIKGACGRHADLGGRDRNGGYAGLALGSLLVGDQIERVAREVVAGVDHTDIADELVIHHQVMRSCVRRGGQETGDGEDGNGVVHVEVSE